MARSYTRPSGGYIEDKDEFGIPVYYGQKVTPAPTVDLNKPMTMTAGGIQSNVPAARQRGYGVTPTGEQVGITTASPEQGYIESPAGQRTYFPQKAAVAPAAGGTLATSQPVKSTVDSRAAAFQKNIDFLTERMNTATNPKYKALYQAKLTQAQQRLAEVTRTSAMQADPALAYMSDPQNAPKVQAMLANPNVSQQDRERIYQQAQQFNIDYIKQDPNYQAWEAQNALGIKTVTPADAKFAQKIKELDATQAVLQKYKTFDKSQVNDEKRRTAREEIVGALDMYDSEITQLQESPRKDWLRNEINKIRTPIRSGNDSISMVAQNQPKIKRIGEKIKEAIKAENEERARREKQIAAGQKTDKQDARYEQAQEEKKAGRQIEIYKNEYNAIQKRIQEETKIGREIEVKNKETGKMEKKFVPADTTDLQAEAAKIKAKWMKAAGMEEEALPFNGDEANAKIGQVYTNQGGSKARYLGNGKWEIVE